MIIQATSHGTAAKEEPFAFTYSGDFTDNRVDGVGTVRLNTSGVLTVTGSPVTVSAYILGGGGGAQRVNYVGNTFTASGGGGGYQTITVTLEPGTYEIVVGVGGQAYAGSSGAAGDGAFDGGDTTAFGYTSTGGGGAKWKGSTHEAGKGGTPNGGKGSLGNNSAGGKPNGGAMVSNTPQNGGDGYVELTFS